MSAYYAEALWTHCIATARKRYRRHLRGTMFATMPPSEGTCMTYDLQVRFHQTIARVVSPIANTPSRRSPPSKTTKQLFCGGGVGVCIVYASPVCAIYAIFASCKKDQWFLQSLNTTCFCNYCSLLLAHGRDHLPDLFRPNRPRRGSVRLPLPTLCSPLVCSSLGAKR